MHKGLVIGSLGVVAIMVYLRDGVVTSIQTTSQ
jgi:hypothetical protein